MGYGEEVNTSDFDSDIHGFDSHYPCLCQVFYMCWFKSNYPSFKSTEPPQAYLSDFYCLGNKSID